MQSESPNLTRRRDLDLFRPTDPLPHNLISNPISNDRSKTVKTRYRVREPETDSKARDSDGRIKMLGPVTAITISSTNPATSAKPQQPDSGSAASSSEKTPSRRTGSWLSGQGSRTGLKTPLRQQEEKAEGSSSLLVPQLTVIGPTPEASPISPTTPTRRVHHKSTPTMPPKSILPPVIEKAYSNGSVKRKAEDADVEGDKTPPKEKEQRATFAPDPRSMYILYSSTIIICLQLFISESTFQPFHRTRSFFLPSKQASASDKCI